MKFATVYTAKDEREHNWATYNTEPSMTQQSDASETDINVIMAKYKKTGQLPRVLAQPLFGDFSGELDYRTAVERINEAQDAFMEIPSHIRNRFGNDPSEFTKFCMDPKNKDELERLGLTDQPPKPTLAEESTATLKEIRDSLKATKTNEGKN